MINWPPTASQSGRYSWPFFRHDADNLPALFPQALGDALEHGGFARAAGAEGGEVAVGVLVVVKEVHKCRGAVVEIQPQEDAARVAQLVGREGKRPGNPLCLSLIHI